MKRPLVPVVGFFVGGILAAEFVTVPLLALFLPSFALLAIAVVWARGRPLLLPPLIALTGATCLTMHTAVISPIDLRCLLPAQLALAAVRGTVCETPTLRVFEQDAKPSWRTLARVDVEAVSVNQQAWRPAVGRMAISTPAGLTNVFAGQTVEVNGVVDLPRAAMAQGLFDYRAYLKEQGIHYQLKAVSAEDWKIVYSPAAPPLSDRFRNWARAALARGLPEEDEALRLEWALTLGWKTALTGEVSEPFVQAATYHIFAVDGLRMAIIFGIFFGLFRALGLPRGLCGAILIPLIWFYVALTGWPASAIRATVMLTVVIAGWVLKRPSDLINSLFAAALIILIWDPQQLFQAGFQLSFLVVLCMILILPPLWRLVDRFTAGDPLLPSQLRTQWPAVVRLPARYLSDLLLTSFAAWIGSIPLVAYYFNLVTPVSTPANIVAVPLCSLVLISNLASLLLAGWLPAVADLFNHAGWFWMEAIRRSSEWFAAWPSAFCYVQAPGLISCGLYYGLLLGLLTGWLAKPEWRRWKLAGVTTVLLAWGWSVWQQQQVWRLTILPVNGGTAIYFDAGSASTKLLIDTGTTNSVQFLTKPFLRAQGVNRLPALVLSHGDLHHIGGAETAAGLFDVRRVYTSPLRFRSKAYRNAIAHFGERPGLLQTVKRQDRLGPWSVLHPDTMDRFTRADDGAIALAGELRGTRVLLLSDLGRAGQNALLERSPNLAADILVTGLPSTGEPVCDALLKAVHPKIIIVSDSEFPVLERASAALRERLDRTGIPVIYTRFTGAATIEFRPTGWALTSMRGPGVLSHRQADGTYRIELSRDKSTASNRGPSTAIDQEQDSPAPEETD